MTEIKAHGLVTEIDDSVIFATIFYERKLPNEKWRVAGTMTRKGAYEHGPTWKVYARNGAYVDSAYEVQNGLRALAIHLQHNSLRRH